MLGEGGFRWDAAYRSHRTSPGTTPEGSLVLLTP
jgi:hypothetical protein